jgi:(p)ppGpp synthase/HD superfamily hydrolase
LDWSNPQRENQIQSLLLSVTHDFRGLAIRSAACLYRLEGILLQSRAGTSEYLVRTPETIRAAKEGMRVYAILAERLGMQQLKAKIEDASFRILYKRQYQAISSLYLESGQAMNSLSNSLQTHITHMMVKDDKLMAQIEGLQISARVKEPFSLWKKLLKKRAKNFDEFLSLRQVKDSVALRVVFRARKWTEDEDDETTRAREQLLCYYIQNLLRTKWGASRLKDYIQYPKPNGYRSLHHTSFITSGGIDLPFEVQVRSEEMHQAAEFGMASHWYYKLDAIAPSMEEAVDPPPTLLLSPCKGDNTTVSLPTADENKLVEQYAGFTGSYLDALEVAQHNMLKQHVYVFMTAGEEKEEGRLVSLPSNSRVQDALLAIDSKLWSIQEETVWRNGQVARLDDSIENGDVLWIAS